jgi:hypothetical protein
MMCQHWCDVCGQPATIHETLLASGVATDRHVCYAHGEAMLLKPTAGFQHDEFQTLVEHYRGLPALEKEQMALYYRLSRRIAS